MLIAAPVDDFHDLSATVGDFDVKEFHTAISNSLYRSK